MGGRCPTCLDTGTYAYHGDIHECPDDDYGHVRLRLFKLYCLANIPLEFQQLDWSTFPHQDVRDQVAKYIANFETIRLHGLGWEIMGKKMGVGKSWTASHLLKAIVLAGYSGWWIQFMDLKSVYEIADVNRREFITDKLMNSEALVIDDILKPRSDKMRDFYEDQLEEVVRHRASRNLVTITTTNMLEPELEELLPRVYSVLSAKQIRLELDDNDHRRQQWQENEELLLNGEVRPITFA